MVKKLIPPTRAEAVQIDRGIAVDSDNPEWADEDFERARPAREILPPRLYEAAVKRYRGQRGPQKSPVKKPVTLRVDPDIIAGYRATGPGWQSRMNEALRRALISRRDVSKSPSSNGGKIAGDKQLFVEKRKQGDYAVRKGNSERASAVEPTQAKAIRKAKELNPNKPPLVERIRNMKGGRHDKWRKP
jgi:uncharacterized protein (DUF4415 family)